MFLLHTMLLQSCTAQNKIINTRVDTGRMRRYYVAAKATYIRLLLGQNGGFPALAP